jgi:hypothetical protein
MDIKWMTAAMQVRRHGSRCKPGSEQPAYCYRACIFANESTNLVGGCSHEIHAVRVALESWGGKATDQTRSVAMPVKTKSTQGSHTGVRSFRK